MNRKKISIFILIIVIFLVLYFTLKNDFNGIVSSIGKTNKLILLISVLFFIFYLFLKSISLIIFIKERNEKYSLKKAFSLTVIAQLLNGITPFQTGGQPFQIYVLKKEGIRVGDATISLIKDFISYQIALIITGIISLIINYKFSIIENNRVLNMLILSGFLINLIVLIILILIMTAKQAGKKVISSLINYAYKFKAINKRIKKVELLESLDNFYKTGSDIKKNRINLVFGVFINFMALIVLYLIPFIIVLSLSSKISARQAIVGTAFAMLVGNFVPIPGASGGIEYAFIKFFGNFLKNPILGSAMILWRFVTYVFGMLMGFIFLTFKMNNAYHDYRFGKEGDSNENRVIY